MVKWNAKKLAASSAVVLKLEYINRINLGKTVFCEN
jgi:hypothetical protein